MENNNLLEWFSLQKLESMQESEAKPAETVQDNTIKNMKHLLAMFNLNCPIMCVKLTCSRR